MTQTYREYQRELRRELVYLAGAPFAGDWIADRREEAPSLLRLERKRERSVSIAIDYGVRIPRSLRRFVPKDEP